MKTDRALAAYSNAALHYLRVRDELEAARQQRDAALVEVYQSGVRKCDMWDTVRNYLLLHGFTAKEHLTYLALSPASIRLVLERSLRL